MTRSIGMSEAIREGIIAEMERDPSVILIGEDIGAFGGAFHVTHGLLERFGARRVHDTPISEAGITGLGIGAALTGLRPIVEFQYLDFTLVAMDQIVNEAAKLRLMSGGRMTVPLVFRGPQGATGRGAQHSQSVEGWFMHAPGLKVVAPSNPYDAKGLIATAIRDPDPVLFIEHKTLYGTASPGGGAAVTESALRPIGADVPEDAYTIPFGVADVKHVGSDVTIVATMLMVHRSLAAAERLADEHGISVEVIDPRTLVPLDVEGIAASVRKTHHALVVSEDVSRAGAGAELAAVIGETCFYSLEAPVRRLCGANSPIPFGPASERHAIPQVDDIVAAVQSVLQG